MMTIGTSTDYGLTWKILGRSSEAPTHRFRTRRRADSCILNGAVARTATITPIVLHNGGYHSWDGGYTFIARATASDPGPGKWKKYFNGAWNEPGVDGKSTPIDGSGVAWWTTIHEMIGLKGAKGSIGISRSSTLLHFTPILSQPLMLIEPGDWEARKNGLELVAYTSTGSMPIRGSTSSATTGCWRICGWKPRREFRQTLSGLSSRRYFLVARAQANRKLGEMPILHRMVQPRRPPRSLCLRQHQSAGQFWAAYGMVAQLGYMMTAPDSKEASTELEECVSQGSRHLDHLDSKGRLRNPGLQTPAQRRDLSTLPYQPNTQPLYRHYSPDTEKSHFAANKDDCNGMGKRRKPFWGYDLKQ